MDLPVIHVYTHDSIGLARTARPTSRSSSWPPAGQPNVYVCGPRDANETALAWEFALEQTTAPGARPQPPEPADPGPRDGPGRRDRARRLRAARLAKDGDPDVILIGTGSEVRSASGAAEAARGGRLATRVVSTPCLDRFAEQDEDYRDACSARARGRGSLSRPPPPSDGSAGPDRGWEAIAMTTFGQSAPPARPIRALRLHPRERGRAARAVVERVPRPPERSQTMSVGAAQNERLAALTPRARASGSTRSAATWSPPASSSGSARGLSLRGVTSNPAIFEKAILGSTDYDEQIARARREGHGGTRVFDEIAILDVQKACDVLRPFGTRRTAPTASCRSRWSPRCPRDRAAVEQARDYWERVDRPNLMIKIPGTGRACRRSRSDRRGDQRERDAAVLGGVIRDDRRGLHPRHGAPTRGGRVARHPLGGELLVSRVDTEVDKRLAELGKEDLRGDRRGGERAGRLPAFKELFYGERFAALREAGRRSSARCGRPPA